MGGNKEMYRDEDGVYHCDEEEMAEFDRVMEEFLDLYEEKTGKAEELINSVRKRKEVQDD